jgi:serine/threonine-protein kinase RsbW
VKTIIEHGPDARVCVVRLEGDVDISSEPEVRRALETVVNRGCTNVVLDLAGVEYADSSALGIIVWMNRVLEPKGGRLVLAGATKNVSRVLELSGLVGVAPTVAAARSAEEALAGLELPPVVDEPSWTRHVVMPADSASMGEARARVAAALEPLHLDEATMFDVRVALGEALSNAVRHGSPGGGADTVNVDVSVYADRIVLVVSDTGAGFDGDVGEGSDPYAASGRGVMFMRALMDRVEFVRLPEGGTAVTLVKHIERREPQEVADE